ncbi:MAG: sulfate adenylyltransferase [Pseudomonadota bacterium]|nr:sulfate adenylyltransferase [Pseudomonadota bacterium]
MVKNEQNLLKLVIPHGGGELKPKLLGSGPDAEEERIEALKKAAEQTAVTLTSRETSDLLMLAMGAYTPLEGFMGQEDWLGSCVEMKLNDGTFWPIPITLSCDEEIAKGISKGEEVSLVDGETGQIMAVMEVLEKYIIDPKIECTEVFQTNDPAHPGVTKVMNQGKVNLGGPVRVLTEGRFPKEFEGLYLRPVDTRSLFLERGWSRVAAFQTRNPMHRSHEYLAKIAIEICDGLLIHQVLGKLKSGDIPADVRTTAIDALVKNYFASNTVIQAGYPIEMRYAGPREALLHALFRQNFGCTHLVVGRDHAGVGDYYGPLDAHHIFDSIDSDSLEIEPLKIDITFYCNICQGTATSRTCPHDETQRLEISGTRLREMFANKEPIPTTFSRPEVIEVLRAHYENSS